MSTMTRTDIHRPSAVEFDPENYEVFGFADFHETQGSRPVQVVAALVAEGWSFRGAPHGSGQCSHCGTHLRYAALMGHTATKTLMYVGETCLDNRFSGTKTEFDAMRKAAAAKAEQSRREGKASAFLAEHPEAVYLSYARNIEAAGGVEVWTTWDGGEYSTQDEAEKNAQGCYVYTTYKRGTTWADRARFSKMDILSDMWFKIEKYGSLSDKALSFANSIMEWADQADTRLQAQEAEAAAKVAAGVKVPTGRIVVEGEVVSTKYVESQYGSTLKMLVVTDEGWKVWGTVPSSIEWVGDRVLGKGDRVRFTATVEPSDDDPSFGFYKRPTKAEKI